MHSISGHNAILIWTLVSRRPSVSLWAILLGRISYINSGPRNILSERQLLENVKIHRIVLHICIGRNLYPTLRETAAAPGQPKRTTDIVFKKTDGEIDHDSSISFRSRSHEQHYCIKSGNKLYNHVNRSASQFELPSSLILHRLKIHRKWSVIVSRSLYIFQPF